MGESSGSAFDSCPAAGDEYVESRIAMNAITNNGFLSLRNLTAPCVSAVIGHRRDAENAEEAQRVPS